MAEHAVSIYFEIVWCMLHSARMDLCYWGEAFLYAVHICSCTYTAPIKGIVPLEAWSGKRPDISHLWIFMSITYINIPKKLCGGNKLPLSNAACLGGGQMQQRDINLRILRLGN